MTSTQGRRTVRQTTALVRSRGRSREVVVILSGSDIAMRLKGERKTYRLPASLAYTMAVQAHVLSEKARRKAERMARRGK